MKKVISLIISAVMVAGLAVGCASKPADNSGQSAANGVGYEPVTITHQYGTTTIEEKPEVVAVFDYGALDTLDTLGIQVAGVSKASLPDYLSEYAEDKYQDLGGLKEPNLEAISEMAPDLIIISGRQADFYEELSQIAPTLYLAIDNSKYIDSIKANITTLADIFDIEKEAEEKLATLTTRAEEVKAQIAEKTSGKKSLTILTNDGSISAYGPGSRFALVDAMGFALVDDTLDSSTHGQKIGYEYISEKNPDYIFVVDRSTAVGSEGESSAKQSLENDLVKRTNAYKEGNIIYLNPTNWYLAGGGLTSLSEMIEELAVVVK